MQLISNLFILIHYYSNNDECTRDNLCWCTQVLLDNIQSWSFLSVVLDNYTWASANLSWLAFFVNFAETRPFAQFLAAVNTEQWNLMFVAQGCDQLLVLWLIAAFGEDAEDSLASRKRKQCHWLLFNHITVSQINLNQSKLTVLKDPVNIRDL